jgi:hypothetical protein
MDVQPTNNGERLYAIIVLVFGLILFSSFISSITNSMTQLRNRDGDKTKQLWLLRRYLKQHSVDTSLTWRILRYTEFTCFANRNQVSASKIWCLNMLSHGLQHELNFAVSYASMKSHPFFEATDALCSAVMRRLAEYAMAVQSLASDDSLFVSGSKCATMYFVDDGRLSYLHHMNLEVEEPSLETLGQHSWACEAALWTDWYTLGALMAVSESKIVKIDHKAFGDVLANDCVVLDHSCTYAQNFVKWLGQQRYAELTDVAATMAMKEVSRKFLDPELRMLQRSRVSRRVTTKIRQSTPRTVAS